MKQYTPLVKADGRPGLYVEHGALMREGKEYFGIGVNFFGAFINYFCGGINEFDDMFAMLAGYGIEYCRMNIGLFWPVNYEQWDKNKIEYYDKLDEVVQSAEKNNIGIICSFFWNPQGISDYFDEPQNAWGDENSQTRAYMAEYIEIIVSRYAESPAIWGYEFGNELNLGLDLPNAAELRNSTIHTELGTRAARDENDDLTTEIAEPLLRAFAELVKKYDRHGRIITSGNAEPRPSQFNQHKSRSWKTDKREEMAQTIKWHNPAPMDCVSVHIYDLLNRFLKKDENSYANIIKAYQEEAQAQGKALFIGEFFGNDTRCEDIIDAIVETRVPISAVWAVGSVEHTISNDAERQKTVLAYIERANKKR
ncbi:MAG: cellulase family glycosylhydrolase [Oscillospiraceae bacterium]|nr:cellulase family glycosylhydrolase [Oscillospiraceae bacterium]